MHDDSFLQIILTLIRFRIRGRLASVGIPMLKIRLSCDRLIFNMGIPYLENMVFILRWGPGHCDKTSYGVVILRIFSPLAALEVAILPFSGAASNEHFVKMTTFPFHWTAKAFGAWLKICTRRGGEPAHTLTIWKIFVNHLSLQQF